VITALTFTRDAHLPTEERKRRGSFSGSNNNSKRPNVEFGPTTSLLSRDYQASVQLHDKILSDGTSTFGTVQLGTFRGEKVAIKKLYPEFGAIFEKEIKVLR
jgi:hypothetical protein